VSKQTSQSDDGVVGQPGQHP